MPKLAAKPVLDQSMAPSTPCSFRELAPGLPAVLARASESVQPLGGHAVANSTTTGARGTEEAHSPLISRTQPSCFVLPVALSH